MQRKKKEKENEKRERDEEEDGSLDKAERLRAKVISLSIIVLCFKACLHYAMDPCYPPCEVDFIQIEYGHISLCMSWNKINTKSDADNCSKTTVSEIAQKDSCTS